MDERSCQSRQYRKKEARTSWSAMGVPHRDGMTKLGGDSGGGRGTQGEYESPWRTGTGSPLTSVSGKEFKNDTREGKLDFCFSWA